MDSTPASPSEFLLCKFILYTQLVVKLRPTPVSVPIDLLFYLQLPPKLESKAMN